MCYPAKTVPLPWLTLVHPPNGSPTLAMGFPLTNTDPLPLAILELCAKHTRLGTRCDVLALPTVAAGIPSTNTDPLPEAMLNGLQCGTP